MMWIGVFVRAVVGVHFLEDVVLRCAVVMQRIVVICGVVHRDMTSGMISCWSCMGVVHLEGWCRVFWGCCGEVLLLSLDRKQVSKHRKWLKTTKCASFLEQQSGVSG